ncbi:MAG TPA: TolC family protein, partial [Chitinophagaceae bacterium]|nr:TolC family protein [Chitinophagaceae bacterium]
MKQIFLATIGAMLLTLAAPAQKQLTLNQALETALNNNLTVKQSGLLAETAEVGWKQARLNRLPDLNALVNHGINQGRSIDPFTNSYVNQQVQYGSYGLSSGIVLFNGFNLQHSLKRDALSYEAARMDLQ